MTVRLFMQDGALPTAFRHALTHTRDALSRMPKTLLLPCAQLI